MSFFFLPLAQSLYGWTEYTDVITKFSGIDRFEKEINCKTAGDNPACCQVYWRRQVWPAEILLWKSHMRCYDQLWFGHLFFFGSIGFNFLLLMGLGADALLERRKSGKCKKYLCKLENTEKSIFFSVKPNFKSDIQNIFNCLFHFHARQMDQRLGFSLTE